MPKVYVTQIPHKKDPETDAFVPILNITPATEHGEVEVLMPPRAAFFDTRDLIRQLEEKLKHYDYEAGDSIVTLGDPVVAAAACAILGRHGKFTVLKWDKQLGRYVTARIAL